MLKFIEIGELTLCKVWCSKNGT